MNQDIAEGKWKQLKGRLKEEWGKLTDDDVNRIEGRLDRFSGIMQEKYGMKREDAEKAFEKLKH